MQRRIAGFHVDGEGDWVADLDCGHTRHVRHRPPFFNRPWVVDPEQRAQHHRKITFAAWPGLL